MKKPIFYIATFLILLLTASCTTDSYDKDMDNSTIQTNENTDSTDPIIIPKKD